MVILSFNKCQYTLRKLLKKIILARKIFFCGEFFYLRMENAEIYRFVSVFVKNLTQKFTDDLTDVKKCGRISAINLCTFYFKRRRI